MMMDVVVEVDDDPGIFERYSLEQNMQCLAQAQHAPLLADLLTRASQVSQGIGRRPPVRSTPGGVIPNALRAAAWWLTQRNAGTQALRPALKMLGMVGQDPTANELRKCLQEAGVEPLLLNRPHTAGEDPSSAATRTGVCACLIANKNRTMVTELGAGRTMELHGRLTPSYPSWWEHVTGMLKEGSTEIMKQVGAPTIVLLSGFYIQADPDGFEAVRRWASIPQPCYGGGTQRPLLAVGIGANWCARVPAVQEALRLADFAFANESEVFDLASAISEKQSAAAPTDFNDALATIARWKESGWMIGTRGSETVGAVKASQDPAPPLFVPVSPVPQEKFVDDVGAGDAFMGGFVVAAWQRIEEALIAQSLKFSVPEEDKENGDRKRLRAEESIRAVDLLGKADIEACAKVGIAVAATVIQQVGCQFPKTSQF